MNAAETKPEDLGLSDSLIEKIASELPRINGNAEIEEDLADDQPTDPQIWRKTFQEYIDSPPQDGDMLRTADGSSVKLTIELTQGKPPFIYGRAYVPTEVGCRLGWFAQGVDNTTDYGWKIILLPKSRDQVIKRLGIKTNTVQVQSLLIIRKSLSGKALLGEVCEW